MIDVVRNNLKDIRLAEGLSVADLVRLSEISGSTIRTVERGASDYPLTLHKLVKGLNRFDRRSRDYAFPEVFPNHRSERPRTS